MLSPAHTNLQLPRLQVRHTALPPSFLRRQEPRTPAPAPSSPNSSLPPTRGEVRWGVRGSERPPASEWPPALFESGLPASCRALPPSFPRLSPSFPYPSPSFPYPLHHTYALSVTPTPSPSFLRPSPSFLRRQEPTHPHIPYPFPNSSLPPTRGEVRWGVEASERPPASEWPPALFQSALTIPSSLRPLHHTYALSATPAPLSVIPVPPPSHPYPLHHTCAPLRHSCAGRNPPHPRIHTSPTPSPIHPSPLPGGRLGGGWKPAS